MARTHQTIETALRGLASLALVALLVGETPLASTAHLLTREELDEHLRRQQARCTDGAQQRAIGDIREAVRASAPDRAPVLVATREGRVILQWVTGEPPPAPVLEDRDRRKDKIVTGEARRAVLRLLAAGVRTGIDLREELSPRFRSSVVGDAITALHTDLLIAVVERRGRWVKWRLTNAGRAAASGKAAA